MDQRESRHLRLYLLGCFLTAVLLVYLCVLYDIQINNHQEYVSQSIRSIVRPEQVEASRGVITDRNGRILVSNRPTYNLTFDTRLLKSGEDQNEAILRLISLCREREVEWTDTLPITREPPYSLTVDSVSNLYKGCFLSYLKRLKSGQAALTAYLLQHPDLVETEEDAAEGDSPEAPLTEAQRGEALLKKLTGSQLTNQLLYDAGITAAKVLQWMQEDFDFSPQLSQTELRDAAGVRYEISLRALDISTMTYVLAEDIDTEFISVINDAGCAGAKVISAYARKYETANAAHILGTVTPIYATDDWADLSSKGYQMDDTIGRTGAESAFEEYLRGIDGRRMVSTNSDGKITGEYYSKAPQPGGTVELTIDLKFQQAAEEALANTVAGMSEADGNVTRGAGLAVVKVGTGEVLALATCPTYDPASFYTDYEALSANPANPFLNRATSGRYPPGSTFKPVVAVAALEEGVVTPSEQLRDPGYWVYPETIAGTGTWRWNCWYRPGHGLLNITQAITVSCNSFFFEMGYRLGIDTIDEYALAFGLGKSTGLEIGDNAGLLAGPAEREARGGVWYGGDTVQAAIGQSDNLFTPLQLANYIATLVSGGQHYDAHLLKSVKTYDNSEVIAVGNSGPSNVISISEDTLELVKTGMKDLTTSSLAVYFQNCVVDAGAKTGTAQLGGNLNDNGVFVCFAPYDEPEIAMALVIEQGNSGSLLASTAVEVINAYFTANEDAAVVTGENQLLP